MLKKLSGLGGKCKLRFLRSQTFFDGLWLVIVIWLSLKRNGETFLQFAVLCMYVRRLKTGLKTQGSRNVPKSRLVVLVVPINFFLCAYLVVQILFISYLTEFDSVLIPAIALSKFITQSFFRNYWSKGSFSTLVQNCIATFLPCVYTIIVKVYEWIKVHKAGSAFLVLLEYIRPYPTWDLPFHMYLSFKFTAYIPCMHATPLK